MSWVQEKIPKNGTVKLKNQKPPKTQLDSNSEDPNNSHKTHTGDQVCCGDSLPEPACHPEEDPAEPIRQGIPGPAAAPRARQGSGKWVRHSGKIKKKRFWTWEFILNDGDHIRKIPHGTAWATIYSVRITVRFGELLWGLP